MDKEEFLLKFIEVNKFEVYGFFPAGYLAIGLIFIAICIVLLGIYMIINKIDK